MIRTRTLLGYGVVAGPLYVAVAFLAGFAGIASGSHGPATLAFVAAVVLVCAWIATVCGHAYRTA